MAFYGDLFRPPGQLLAVGDPYYRVSDVEPGFETELLLEWWEAAAAAEPQVVAPGADTLVGTPGSVQAALRALSHSKFFGGLALRTLVFDLKQVRRYLTDPELRAAARARVTHLIGPDTRSWSGIRSGPWSPTRPSTPWTPATRAGARRMGEGTGCARWSPWGHRSASGT